MTFYDLSLQLKIVKTEVYKKYQKWHNSQQNQHLSAAKRQVQAQHNFYEPPPIHIPQLCYQPPCDREHDVELDVQLFGHRFHFHFDWSDVTRLI